MRIDGSFWNLLPTAPYLEEASVMGLIHQQIARSFTHHSSKWIWLLSIEVALLFRAFAGSPRNTAEKGAMCCGVLNRSPIIFIFLLEGKIRHHLLPRSSACAAKTRFSVAAAQSMAQCPICSCSRASAQMTIAIVASCNEGDSLRRMARFLIVLARLTMMNCHGFAFPWDGALMAARSRFSASSSSGLVLEEANVTVLRRVKIVLSGFMNPPMSVQCLCGDSVDVSCE